MTSQCWNSESDKLVDGNEKNGKENAKTEYKTTLFQCKGPIN